VRALLPLLALGALSACGTTECTAEFSGNFADQARGPAACPTVSWNGATWLFKAKVVAPVAASTLQVSIDLGQDVAAGVRTSEGQSSHWQATSTRDPGCIASAGDLTSPQGAYRLSLEALDTHHAQAHGSLTLEQAVLALDDMDCGPGSTEQVRLDF
jgi:hypothetical protein